MVKYLVPQLAGMLYSAAEEGICWQYLACDGVRKMKSLSGLRRRFLKKHHQQQTLNQTNMATATTLKPPQNNTKHIHPKLTPLAGFFHFALEQLLCSLQAFFLCGAGQ